MSEVITADGYEPQAAVVKITPSARPFPWHGFRKAGYRFSAEQDQAMVIRGLDPATAPTLCVRRQQPEAETWTPTGQVPPEYRFDCPIIGPGKGKNEGKVLVIAPSGEPRHVRADGWAHNPRGPRRRSACW